MRLTWRSNILIPVAFVMSLILAAQHGAFACALLSGFCGAVLGAFSGVLAFCRWGDITLMQKGEINNAQS